MLVAYKKFWQQTFHFKGVTSRAEFWWAFLVNLIFEVIFQAMQYLRSFDFNEHPSARVGTGNPHMNHWLFAGGEDSVMANTFLLIAIIFMLVTLIPKLSIAIRRSHDFNWSGYWIVGLWIIRFALVSYTMFELILLVDNYGDHHINAAMGNFEQSLLAMVVFFALEIVELILLTKKSKRPNRFLTGKSAEDTVTGSEVASAEIK